MVLFIVFVFLSYLTGAEVLPGGAGPRSTLLLQLPDPYRDCSFRDVQHAHQHLHQGPEGEVSLGFFCKILTGDAQRNSPHISNHQIQNKL